MNNVTATYLGIAIGFIVTGFLSYTYLKPYLNKKNISIALIALIVPHAFRFIALQLFSAQATGLVVSDTGRDLIAYGDVLSALFAVVALWAINKKASWTKAVVWSFVVFAFTDLSIAVMRSMTEELSKTADPVLFLVSSVYVPFLFMTLFLLFEMLIKRKKELAF